MSRLITALSTALLAITFAVTAAAPAHAATPIRIMPLGDSITGGPGCWRALLWDRLQRNGFTNIDFVGTQPGGGCGLATWDGDNEGHGGFSATGIANQNQLPGWLAATHPDIVLMHLGTNDIWGNTPTASILAAYSTLVDQMRASNPAMKVLVAQIIPMTPSGCTWCPSGVTALDSAIPAWAAGKSTAQSPITVVDQYTGFDSVADTSDGVHPVDSGFQKMADRWYPALTPLLAGNPPADTTAPTVPSGLGVQVSCSLVSTLTWTASTDNVGVTGYDVFRAPGSGGTGTFVPIGTTATTTFTDTLNNVYQYEVRARDAAGNTSAFTAPVTAYPPPCPPPDTQPPTTPGTPTATITCGSAALTWTPSTDNIAVAGYEIWRAPGASGGTFTQVGTTTTTSFALPGAGMFRIEIRARDAAGNTSPFTPPITITTPACPTDVQPPSTPGTPTASATATSATLAWPASTDNVGVTGYDIYRALGSGTFTSIGTSVTTTFTDTGLSPATTYRYQVRARDAAGNTSGFSAAVTVQTSGAGGCSATLTAQSVWATGYVMQPNTVTNSGTTTINGWTVTFTLPAGHTITGSWNAIVTVSGQTVTARGIPGQNTTLAPGATTTWGFQATRAASDTVTPSGAACTSP
ncbi:cellulose binding domain-containing protein [Hamadaea tsunoensis]|uniref:cellulose binding domain-containing protein n=1 Tax=Hamadaea tsunoensis TaxID=53368 RepID=UPI00042568FC|nr:cellulose binding domain-containing protein [Hamadaea tsunoensis]